jgi:phytoene dehydrogenase-like protein
MRKLILVSLTILLLCCAARDQQAQQAQPTPQPLTFYYDYTVFPGKEEDLMNLVKTVGALVRDKLMADGVVLAWGVETPILRHPGGTTHLIWFSVANWAGVEKVLDGMEAQLAKLAAEEAKAAEEARRKKRKPAMTTAERTREVFDMSKTRDWLTRDLVSGYGPPPAAGVLPFTRYNFVKVKPGKGGDYRRAWEKYNKPVYDKLVADGVVLAYGLAAEEVKTDGDFTHFVWVGTANMAAADKIGPVFAADRARRSEEERNAISDLFLSLTEPDKSRSIVTRSRIFKLSAPK